MIDKMHVEVERKLLDINQSFYAEFAGSFAQSRQSPQPGYYQLLNHMPSPLVRMVDVGCGNGRFGNFIFGYYPSLDYIGVDFTQELLAIAAGSLKGKFLQRDINCGGFLQGLGKFDLCLCLATLQHIPGRANRLAVLNEMSEHLSDQGRIFLSNWQFTHSTRQSRKIVSWAEVGLQANEVEQNDYLLSWQREGLGIRYVHLLDDHEITLLAAEASLLVVSEFRSDGREGDLNLYSVLAKNA